MRNLFYENWVSAKHKITESEGVLITLGSVEQHGLHLPLGTDVILAHAFAEKICERENMYYYPCITYGQVWSAKEYEGTVSIQESCLESYCVQVVESVLRAKPKRIFLFSFHNGNHRAIEKVQRTLSDVGKGGNIFHISAAGIEKKAGHILTTPLWNGNVWHAGELETSLMLYVEPGLVQMERATKEFPEIPRLYGRQPIPWKSFLESGSFGDAAAGDRQKGEQLFALISSELCTQIQQVKAGEFSNA